MEPNINKISPDKKKIYEQSKLIVIKVGSSLLVEDKLGAIKKDWFASFIDDVIDSDHLMVKARIRIRVRPGNNQESKLQKGKIIKSKINVFVSRPEDGER